MRSQGGAVIQVSLRLGMEARSQTWDLLLSKLWLYIWTVDISLGSSVVELLTGVAGVLGSIHCPVIFFVYFLNFLLSYHKSFNLGGFS